LLFTHFKTLLFVCLFVISSNHTKPSYQLLDIINCFIILFNKHASRNNQQAVVARMLVKLFRIQLGTFDRKEISQVLSPQIGVSYFLYRGSVISRNAIASTSTRDKQDACLGYDDNEDVPIVCLGTKVDRINMRVIL
jgi:hypothetical protein